MFSVIAEMVACNDAQIKQLKDRVGLFCGWEVCIRGHVSI